MDSKAEDAQRVQDSELGARVANLLKFAGAALPGDGGVVQEGPATTQDVILELLRRPNTVDFQKLMEAIPRKAAQAPAERAPAEPEQTLPAPTVSAEAPAPPSPIAADTLPAPTPEPEPAGVPEPMAPGANPTSAPAPAMPKAMMLPPSGAPTRRAASVESYVEEPGNSLLDSSDGGSSDDMDDGAETRLSGFKSFKLY